MMQTRPSDLLEVCSLTPSHRCVFAVQPLFRSDLSEFHPVTDNDVQRLFSACRRAAAHIADVFVLDIARLATDLTMQS